MCFLSFPLFFLFSCPAPFPHQPQTGLNSSATSIANSTSCEGELRLGDRVLVVGQRIGTIKFFGTTNFAPGNSSVYSLPNLNPLEYKRSKMLRVNEIDLQRILDEQFLRMAAVAQKNVKR